jgi:signal transduction histidine kinase
MTKIMTQIQKVYLDKNHEGTGLGLYLCKPISTAPRGHIWCDAGDHGVGTRIAIILPGEG